MISHWPSCLELVQKGIKGLTSGTKGTFTGTTAFERLAGMVLPVGGVGHLLRWNLYKLSVGFPF